ncbi:MAG TPA: hypothetical protein VES88_11445 [Gemmatimonadaceae bacterium]|nr:hypothetical protein [Gemmatimonadaceae bacterium]
MGDVDPQLFRDFANVIQKDALEDFAKRALSDTLGRDTDKHKAWQYGYYTMLTLTSLAMLVGIGLSIVAGLKLMPVEMEVVRWTWGAFFASGGVTALHRFLPYKKS